MLKKCNIFHPVYQSFQSSSLPPLKLRATRFLHKSLVTANARSLYYLLVEFVHHLENIIQD